MKRASAFLPLLAVLFCGEAGHGQNVRTEGNCSPIILYAKVASVNTSCSYNIPELDEIARQIRSVVKGDQLSSAQTTSLIAGINVILQALLVHEGRIDVNTAKTRTGIQHLEATLADIESRPSNVTNVSAGTVNGINGNIVSVGTMIVQATPSDPPESRPLSAIPHPPPKAEADFLRNFLFQLQARTNVGTHVRLSDVFREGTYPDGNPMGPVDWIEGMNELVTEGRISNVKPIYESWTYQGFGANEKFSIDYEFDILNVAPPTPAPQKT